MNRRAFRRTPLLPLQGLVEAGGEHDSPGFASRPTDQGLDPNKWFGNVELMVAKDVGQETVTYVSNIYRYYVAYKLALGARDSK